MNKKEVLVRIVDVENDYMIRTNYTSIPSEILKMYNYMKDQEGLYIYLKSDGETEDNEHWIEKYDKKEAKVENIYINPGGEVWVDAIDVYVRVF